MTKLEAFLKRRGVKPLHLCEGVGLQPATPSEDPHGPREADGARHRGDCRCLCRSFGRDGDRCRSFRRRNVTPQRITMSVRERGETSLALEQVWKRRQLSDSLTAKYVQTTVSIHRKVRTSRQTACQQERDSA